MLHDAPQPLRQPPVRKCGVGNHCGVRHRQAQKHIVMPRRTHIAMQQSVNSPLQSASRTLPPRELPKGALRQPCRPHRVGKIQGSNHPQAANYDQGLNHVLKILPSVSSKDNRKNTCRNSGTASYHHRNRYTCRFSRCNLQFRLLLHLYIGRLPRLGLHHR